MQALSVLKRHGRLDESMFFGTGQDRGTDKTFFLPDISGIMKNKDNKLWIYGCGGHQGSGTDLDFGSDKKKRDAFIQKWKLARLAAMLC